MSTNSTLNRLYQSIRKEFSILLSISIGIFLFVLFFQPFTIKTVDFNNRLLILAGLGAIVFHFMVIGRVILPRIVRKATENQREAILPPYLRGFITLTLNSAAFAFYLKYVGLIDISFYVMFKIVLVCMAPSFILRMYDVLFELRKQNELLQLELKQILKQLESQKELKTKKTIAFSSDNSVEKVIMQEADVAMIRSADNYIEILYQDDGLMKKKMLRNTLRNIENMIHQYPNFIRCHRTCIINLDYTTELVRKLSNYWLRLKGFDELIPISRQYLMQIRQAVPDLKG